MSAYDSDRALMESLGLRTWDFGFDWTDLGTVNVHGATVRVEVSALPAQFWRFTVTRQEDGGPGIEVRIVTTGSGTFTQYWPSVELIADHCLEVEIVQ